MLGQNIFINTAILSRVLHNSVGRMSSGLQGIQTVLDYILDKEAVNDDTVNDICVLGRKYINTLQPPPDQASETAKSQQPDNATPAFGEFRDFFEKVSNTVSDWSETPWPEEFLEDVATRLWFTYRSGFPAIPRDDEGPSPISLGSILRGTLDITTISQGFTTDSGWGCMIRTSQSLLANAFLNLAVGRDWRYQGTPDSTNDEYRASYDRQWEIVKWFADVPTAPFSIQNIVQYGQASCNKKPGEWFGPSDAAQSLVHLCETNFQQCHLKTYLTEGNGDIYEEDFLDQIDDGPVMIFSGTRLGVKAVNPVYWNFLKKLLDLPQSVGIAGGQPSSSHYFFGYQGDYLFYLDPHTPQSALIVDGNEQPGQFIPSVHTKKIRKLRLSSMDPSMLIGLLVKSRQDYLSLKKALDQFDPMTRFINIYQKRPRMESSMSAGSETMLDESFIDLGQASPTRRRESQPVMVQPEEIDFEKDASMLTENDTTENFEEIDQDLAQQDSGSGNEIGRFEKIEKPTDN